MDDLDIRADDPYRSLLLSPGEYEFRALMFDNKLAHHFGTSLRLVTGLRLNNRRRWRKMYYAYVEDLAYAEALAERQRIYAAMDDDDYPHDRNMVRMLADMVRVTWRPARDAATLIGFGLLIVWLLMR
jgi:hypothetical protein